MRGTSHVVQYKRLRHGNYYADFRRDERLKPEVYHCIVQQDGVPDVLSWSQHRSLHAAVQAAEKQLQHLCADESKIA